MTLSTFTLLCNHPSITRTFPASQTETLSPLDTHSPSLPIPPRPSPWQLSFSFPSLWIWLFQGPHISGIIQCLSFCVWLISLVDKNSWELCVKFYLGQNEDCSLRASERALRNCSKEVGGEVSVICDFSEGVCVQSHMLADAGCWSQGADVTINDFSAFPNMRKCKNWAHKFFSWKYLTIWRPVLPVFLEHRGPHSWSPTWTPFRVCWRSAAAVACDLILVEADGKCQFLAGMLHLKVHPMLQYASRIFFW